MIELQAMANQAQGADVPAPHSTTRTITLEQLFGDSEIPFRLTRMQTEDEVEPLYQSAAVLTAEEEGAEEEEEGEDEYDSDEDSQVVEEPQRGSHVYRFLRGARQGTRNHFKEVRAPQEAGVSLLLSGEFGRVRPKINVRSGNRNISQQVFSGRTRSRRFHKEDITGDLVPNTHGTAVASYDENVYSGQFSADSSFYYTGTQHFKIHVYDVTQPPSKYERPKVSNRRRHLYEERSQTTLRTIKTINGIEGRWTMTDTHLSPDNERIIYSSITPVVHMATTLDSSEVQHSFNFADRRSRVPAWGYDPNDFFGIWSCRFSADGNEIVAGGSKKIFVYDILADRRTVKIDAHQEDVNSCCWADAASGNVLVSASDDTFVKVWDRRSLGSSQRPSGVLIGHTEGITNVSAKGDGRYIISNGKDQALRLWDLRKMRSNEEYEAVADKQYGIPSYDYRYSYYPKPRYAAHPKDCSVMTYRGHSVMQTLIRCHFSPAETTGSQYIYSGSSDGRVHIWSLDGRVVQVLDRAYTNPMAFDPSGAEPPQTTGEREIVCVRDVSWHSKEPVIFSAGFETETKSSIVARHEWKGLSKTPGALEDHVEKQKLERAQRAQGRSQTRRRMPGHLESDDETE
ncbi:WD40-repeat-containing domain protein [Amylostereum chailletii]|nr:WD40-repeat-containing domain protein [Amylostereum chailletii]